MSTSYDSSKNVFCNYPIKMVIQAPKGTHMFATKNHAESEVIFMSNTKYKVLSARILDNNGSSRQIEILCTVMN